MRNTMKRFGLSAMALSLALLISSFTPAGNVPDAGSQDGDCTINSRYGGVQIGAITYSFRSIREVDAVLQACVDAGLSSVELMGTGIEAYLGAPESPLTWREMRRPDELSDEKKAVYDTYQEDLKAWRADPANMDKYAKLRKKFNDAGVNIHIYKWVAGMSDEELDYSFKVAKTLGAIGITTEIGEENCTKVGAAAERAGMLAIFHNHFQYAEEDFDVDVLLALSPANRLNFDIGHYYGSTGKDPVAFIEKYHKRIASIHLKDKTGANNETKKNANQVWGQGETPIAGVLQVIQKNQWGIYCDIELEYKIAPWSDAVKEVKICREFCRQILL
ncbi:MAG: sugar phosphate isomerase/epimerase [Bacteroidota bacterium]